MNGQGGFVQPPPPPEPQPEKKKGCVTGKRVLGCGCGCLTLIVAAMAVAYLWVTASLPLTSGEIYIDADTVSLVWLRMDISDKGISELFNTVVAEVEADRVPGELRETLRKVGKESVREMVELFLPAEVICLSPVGLEIGDEDAFWAVSYHRAYKPLNWVFAVGVDEARRRNAASVTTHNGTQIVKSDEKGEGRFSTSIDNNILVSRKLELLKNGVDRFRKKASDFGGNALLKEMHGKLSANRDAFGLVVNKENALASDYEIFVGIAQNHPEVDLDRVKAMSWSIDVVSSDMVKGEMFLKCDSADVASGFSLAFSQDTKGIAEEVAKEGMKVEVNVGSEGEFVLVTFDLTDFKDELIKKVRGE